MYHQLFPTGKIGQTPPIYLYEGRTADGDPAKMNKGSTHQVQTCTLSLGVKKKKTKFTLVDEGGSGR